jgi:cobalamin-dependent methionine synthase I
MTTIARNFARYIAVPAMIGGAALGLAGMANATAQAPTGPGYSYSPDTYAKPAPTAQPGWHNNHGPARIAHLLGS